MVLCRVNRMKNFLIKNIKTYKGEKINKDKKMKKNNLESVEYQDECIFRLIALSTSSKSMEFRKDNKHINWHRCRFNCPQYNIDDCCNEYYSLSKIKSILLIEV